MARNRKKSRLGFTIIEVLIALVVITVGITAVASMLMTAIITRQHAANLKIAEDVLQTRTEAMKRSAFDRLREDFEGSFDVVDPEDATHVVGSGTTSFEDFNGDPDALKTVTEITMGYTREQQVTLRSVTIFARDR